MISLATISPATEAPVFFTPAADQSTVDHLCATAQTVTPRRDGGLLLHIRCGDVGFGVAIPPVPGRIDIQPGDRLWLEFPKGNNPLIGPFSAIYPYCDKPKAKPMSILTDNTRRPSRTAA